MQIDWAKVASTLFFHVRDHIFSALLFLMVRNIATCKKKRPGCLFSFEITKINLSTSHTPIFFQVLTLFWTPFLSGSQTHPWFQNKNSGCRLTGGYLQYIQSFHAPEVPVYHVTNYRKVASSRLSWLVAHPSTFRIFMQGKFDACVLNSGPVYCSQLNGSLWRHY